MDLFKLLINELYLPGVSLFQEIRETFLLDIIDPKILEIDCDYFIKVIAFSATDSILGMGNSGGNNIISNFANNLNVNANNSINFFDNNDNKSKSIEKTNVKLNDMKDLTFTSMGFILHIFYIQVMIKKMKKKIVI